MRAARLFVIVVAVLFAAHAIAEELPDIKNSSVTIPWGDFKEILQKLMEPARAVEPAPPVDYALGRGTLTGALDDGRFDLTATYPLSVLKKGWVLCPLVDTSAPLADVLIDGRTAPVTDYGGKVSLVLKGPAAYTLVMRFRLTAPMRPGPGAVSLQLPQAAGQVLTVNAGKKFSGLTVDGATMSRDASGRTVAILTSDQLTLRYTVAMEKKEVEPEKLQPKVLVENSTLISIDEGFIRAVVQLAYEVRHAPVNEFKIAIPEGFDVADCSGTSLAGWKLDEASRTLTASVGFEVKGAYSLTIVLERSTKEMSFSFPLPGIQAQGVEREHGFFAVQVTGGVEVTLSDEVKGLQVIDAKELPSGLRSGATNPIVLSLKYLRHPFSASLKVVRHETQPVLGAAIDTANYVVQLTEDGDCVTQAVYTVRNNRKQFLEVALPESDEIVLWSSFVAGKPVRPSKSGEGKILLPLEKSGYAGSQLKSFAVELIYYSNLDTSLHPVGVVHLNMPEVDLPISRSMLSVFAPARYKYSRIGGSMRERYVPPKLPELGLLAPAKRMAEGKPRAVPAEKKAKAERYYEDSRLLSAAGEMELQQVEAEQVFRQRIRKAQEAQDKTGALPARFSVPKEGASMRFSELLTVGESSDLRLVYASWKLLTALALLALLITAALAWFGPRLLARPRSAGTLLFASGTAAIFVLAALGVSVAWVVMGAVIGLGGRFVRWLVLKATGWKGCAG